MQKLLHRHFYRIWLNIGLNLPLIQLAGCVVSTPEVPATGPNYGIYWFGSGMTPTNWLYRANRIPTYNPTCPTIVFVHGWKPDQGYTHRTMLWEFEDEDSGDMVTLT